MRVKSLVLVSSLMTALSCLAQASIGTVQNVHGLVTYTDGTVGGTVANGSPIISGTRFMSSSSGSADLRFSAGCVVHLDPNQAVTVTSNMTCPEMLAAVTPVTAAPGVGFASAIPTGVDAAVLGAGALAMALQNNRAVSSQ